MMESDAQASAMLIAASLKPHERKALRRLATTAGGFEPVGTIPGLSETMVAELQAKGLAEEGWANEYTRSVGYRLSPLGSRVHAAIHNLPKKSSSRLATLAPRLKALPPRIR